MYGQEVNLREQIIEQYKDDLVKLLKYLPFLEKKGGKDVSSFYEGDGENKVIPVPVYDSTLLGFVKEVKTTQFINKNYPETWKKSYAERAHYSLGLFLAQYLCNGFNLADAARLQYNDYYFQTSRRAFLFNRKKTADRSSNNSEVVIPIIEPLQVILDEIAAPPALGSYVFPQIFNGETSEKERRKLTAQTNSNIKDRVTKICHDVLRWDKAIRPSGTWCRHSFATNLRNAGVEKTYIDESMGHSSNSNDMTNVYLDTYPIEMQMEYNSKLLVLDTKTAERDELISKLSKLSHVHHHLFSLIVAIY